MALFLQYNLDRNTSGDDQRLFSNIGNTEYRGIFFSRNSRTQVKGKAVQLADGGRLMSLLGQARESGLQTGIVIDCFLDEKLYAAENFTAPVAWTGAIYSPVASYYPLCPNNPVAVRQLFADMETCLTHYSPDYIYLNHFQFPFDWKNQDLDIQDSMPQFCYCPFCITEFSSVMGEIITNSEQIEETMPEWLEWRTDSILHLIGLVKKKIVKKSVQLIIALPPLALIDLPFCTGLSPYEIVDEGVIISPQMYHHTKRKNLSWVEDILDQYQVDLSMRKIWPSCEVKNREERDYFMRFDSLYGNIIVTDMEFGR